MPDYKKQELPHTARMGCGQNANSDKEQCGQQTQADSEVNLPDSSENVFPRNPKIHLHRTHVNYQNEPISHESWLIFIYYELVLQL